MAETIEANCFTMQTLGGGGNLSGSGLGELIESDSWVAGSPATHRDDRPIGVLCAIRDALSPSGPPIARSNASMANNLGLFQWIREGVRQSVLLGVTDALESIGSPDDASKLHPALMSLSSTPAGNLQAAESGEVVARRPGAAPRKRLGRSLKELEPNKPAS